MSVLDMPGLRGLLPNPYLYRVHEHGKYHFTYFTAKREALSFAQSEANEKRGEWVVSKQDRHKQYQCIKRVGPSYRQTSCVPPRRP